MIVVTALSLAVSAAAVATRLGLPTSGAVLGPGGGYGPDGLTIEVLAGADTSLRSGDVVTSIAGRPISTWADAAFDPGGVRLPVAAGDPVAMAVIRDGAPLDLAVTPGSYPLEAVLVANLGTLSFVIVFFGLAAFVFWRRPRDEAAAALLVSATGAFASTVPFLLGVDPLDFATGSVGWSIGATGIVYMLLWAGAIHFGLVFPRPHPRVARRPAWAVVPYVAVFGALGLGVVAGRIVEPGTLGWLDGLAELQLVTILGTFIIISVLLVGAWRRATVEERRVLRGFALAGGFVVVASLVVWVIPELATGRPLVPWTVEGLVGLPIPLSIGSAILRDRAFDIEVVVRRSLVYGTLTAAVIGLYALAVSVLGSLIRPDAAYAVSLLSTGIAAIAALPLRDVLQRGVDRLLYGDRDEPVRAIRRLGDRLAWTVEPSAVPGVVVATVAEALRLPYVGLELGPPEDARLVAEHGATPADREALVSLPLVYRTAPVGRLILSPRDPGGSFGPADMALLDDLARQAGVAAHAIELSAALQRSRETLVTTREEERRRLRRDLHDGLGPTLAAIGLRAETTATLLHSDPDAAQRALADLQAELASAIADIRRLVDGLRPPALDELGLVGAIRQQADRMGASDREVRVEVAEPLPDLPAAVEVAAYRIAVEALTNAVRHSGARQCAVRLTPGEATGSDPGGLTIEVVDDGRGVDDGAPEGIGLVSMRERAAEVGGICRVEPATFGGTRVWARLPITLG